MTKAKFIEEQPEVKVTERDGMYYIFICLNGEWKEEKMPDMFDGAETTERFWECDYNEIVTDDIDIDDIRENPEDYIDYDFRDRNGAVEKRLSTLLKAKKITKDEREYVLTGKKSLSLTRQAVRMGAAGDVEVSADEPIEESEEAEELPVEEEPAEVENLKNGEKESLNVTVDETSEKGVFDNDIK